MVLDDALPESYEVKSWILAAFEFDFPGARKAARRALELAPNNYRAMASLAMGKAIFGRFEEAVTLSAQSIDLEPLDPQMHLMLARILILAGRLDEARNAILTAMKLSPDLTTASNQLMWVELLQGKLDDALAVARREKVGGYRHYGLAIVNHTLGNTSEADEAMAALLAEGDQWAHQFASAYAWRNEKDLAFEWLEKAFALKDAGIPLTGVHPVFKNLHADPRWPAFLKKAGLAEY
jgi:serine/threonine-protein kinase